MQKMGPRTKSFFVTVLKVLVESRIPFLVGGGYAMNRHTGFNRAPRDMDVFLLPSDVERALGVFAGLGYRTDLTFPHWLGKIYRGRTYVDVIFSSGNGIATVDDLWFKHAVEDFVLGQPVGLCPAEEMIWSKAFVMERNRFDGADVIHLLLAGGPGLDWPRLFDRFQSHRLVLLSHLVLFLFAYPSQKSRVPGWVWEDLLARLEVERRGSGDAGRICRGTLLSRGEYLEALEQGYRDARLPPDGAMTLRDVVIWTKAAQEEEKRQ